MDRLVLYGVVSENTKSVVEFFLKCGQAQAFIAEVEQDEPETAARLRVEPG